MPQNNDRNTRSAPVEEIRAGWIKAAIWRNENKDGVGIFNVTIGRTYQDQETKKYHETNSFTGDELLVVSEVARLAWAKATEFRNNELREKRERAQDRERVRR